MITSYVGKELNNEKYKRIKKGTSDYERTRN